MSFALKNGAARGWPMAGLAVALVISVSGAGACLYNWWRIQSAQTGGLQNREAARRALAADPVNSRLVRAAAEAEQRAGDLERTAALMDAAAALSRRDAPTHFWLMNRQIAQERFDAAFASADALLRTSPEFSQIVLEELAVWAREPEATAALARRMATDPPWRAAFISRMAQRADPETAAAFFRAMRLESEPTEFELSQLLFRYLEQGRLVEAREQWEVLMPRGMITPGQLLYDEAFEGLPGPEPFNWAYGSGPGFDGRLEPAPDGHAGRALRVTYDGTASSPFVSQMLVLSRGEYRFTGSFYPITANSGEHFQWRLSCRQTGHVLVALSPSRSETWTSFSQSFTVAGPACDTQLLELRPITARRRINIEGWFDNLTLVRNAN